MESDSDGDSSQETGGDGDSATGDGDGSTGDGSTGDGSTGDGDGTAGDGDGDGDGDGSSGDGTTGDGDGTTGDGSTGDGDGTSGDGDGSSGDGDGSSGDGDGSSGDGDGSSGDGDGSSGDGDGSSGDGSSGDGDGSTGDGDGSSGDGDGSTGDGDGTTGDGDGTTGDGDGDGVARTWGPAQRIETAAVSASAPRVDVDDAGNAVVVWAQMDTTVNSAHGVHYDAGTDSWGVAGALESQGPGAAVIEVSMNGGGDAVAIWAQDDGTGTYDLWSNLYDGTGGSWGTASAGGESRDDNVNSMRVSMDPAGNVVAVWRQVDQAGTISVWGNQRSAATGSWATATLLENRLPDSSQLCDVDTAADGDALAVMSVDGGFANHYSSGGGGWGIVSPLGPGSSTIFYPTVRMTDAGDGIAAWGEGGVRVAAYSGSGATWGNDQLIVSTGERPAIGIDPDDGDALVAWREDTANPDLRAAHFDAGNDTWGSPETVASVTDPDDFNDIGAGMDLAGNAFVAWREGTGATEDVYVRRRAAGGAWEAITLVDTEDGDVDSPRVAVARNGVAVVVWAQDEGTGVFSIWARVYR
jgi:hypothetical protein